MTPVVSVVLPVHNRADVLPRAIASVLEQELSDFELIVVDDGSSDASAEVARSFADDRIEVPQEPNCFQIFTPAIGVGNPLALLP